jgi:CRP-like cAMP-binding protein
MMCFALSPRYYSPNNKDEYVIYDEGDEVLEIVFVLRGEVGVGFKLANSLVDKRFELTSIVGPSNYFADYYVLANVKSEFVYIASSEVHALGLSKRALTNKIFPFFRKSFYEEFSARAKARYI